MIDSRNYLSKFLILLVLVVVTTAVGCGSGIKDEANGALLEKVSRPDRIFSIEDVESIGWKRGKEYDVDGLIGAEAAYLGYWAPPTLGTLNYEIRVYPDHQTAINQGTSFAEESSGETAVLSADDAKWPEGVRDRRVIVGGGSRGSQNPLFGDYVILGNLVILCEGRTPENSIERCAPFVALLLGEGA